MYAISNPRNLARMLSFGVLGSRAVYGDKYAPDGTELAAGRLPLWRQPPDNTLLARIADPFSLVIIEFEDVIEFDDVIVIDGVLPVDLVQAVYFPSEQALKEFTSTPFDNVNPHALELRVSVEFFESHDGPNQVDDMPQPSLLGDSRPMNVSQPVGRAASRMTGEMVDRLDRLVGAALEVCLFPNVTQSALGMAANVLSETLAGRSTLAALASGVGRPDLAEALGIVAEALIHVAHGKRPTRKVLEGLAGEAPESWNHELERVVRVLKSREVFGRPSDWRDPISCALALTLLRESPESIRTEFIRAPDRDQPVVQLALWYAGLLRGLARRPVASRTADLDAYARRGIARLINEPLDSVPVDPNPPRIGHRVDRTREGWSYQLLLNSHEIEVGFRPRLKPTERLRDAIDGGMGVQVAAVLGLPTMIRIRAGVPVSVVSTYDDEGLEITVTGDADVVRFADDAALGEALDSLDAESASDAAERVLGPEAAP